MESKIVTVAVLFIYFTVQLSAVQLQCNFFMTTIAREYQYICHPADTVSGLDEITSIVGEHYEGKNNLDVKGIWFFENPMLTQIPGKLADFFPNLRTLALRKTGLSSIYSEHLRPFPNIIEFALVASPNLTYLDSSLFGRHPKLQLMDFRTNGLTNLGHNLFSSLTDLKSADFRFNICTNSETKTREELPALIEDLRVSCPSLEQEVPIAPPLPHQCAVECLEKIEDLERNISIQGEKIEKQDQVLILYEARLIELEKQMREINANP